MQNIVLVILLILALCLIVTVLMQRSEGGGLGIGGGGNMSGRPPASPVAKFTWMLGAGFMAACLALTVIAAREAKNESVLSGVTLETPQDETAPTSGETGLGDNLLPPAADDAPAAPPAADE